jgi:hypothetical protein
VGEREREWERGRGSVRGRERGREKVEKGEDYREGEGIYTSRFTTIGSLKYY